MAGSRGPKAHARAAVGLGLLLVLGLAPAPAAAGSSLLQPPQRINVGPRNPPPPGIGPEVVGGTTAPIGRSGHLGSRLGPSAARSHGPEAALLLRPPAAGRKQRLCCGPPRRLSTRPSL
jgi:hypothetical protein